MKYVLKRHHRYYLRRFVIVILLIALWLAIISVAIPGKMFEDSAHAPAKPTGTFTIAALPDTQVYSQEYPSIFHSQTQWIVDHAAEKNIIFVTHLGDIVNRGDDLRQWRAADRAMAVLDDKVPYGIAPGNHDFDTKGDTSQFAWFFPDSRIGLSGVPAFMRRFESANPVDFGSFKGRNNYRLFNAGSREYIAMNLQYCPTDDVIDWASAVLGTYSNRTAIIATHSFINFEGVRDSGQWSCKVIPAGEGRNAGTDLWNKLIMRDKRTNVRLFLNGHDIWSPTGAARRTDYVDGKPIHQLMSDYQILPLGGSGYMRLMTFDPDHHKLIVKTYSPYLNKYLTDPENDFTLTM